MKESIYPDGYNEHSCSCSDSSMHEIGHDMDSDTEPKFDLIKFFIFDPNGKFCTYWRLIHIVCCVNSSYIYAYIAGGGDDGKSSSTDFPFVC